MNARLNSSWFAPVLMLLITAVVASTAIRIEWYNHAVGGFLPRPQPPSIEGNEIKWRMHSPHMAEWRYRTRVAYDRGLDFDRADEEDALFAMSLTAGQEREIASIKQGAKLNNEFYLLVASMGCMQYLLVPIGFFTCVVTLKQKTIQLRILASTCLAINLIAGGLMFYREYYPSLGY